MTDNVTGMTDTVTVVTDNVMVRTAASGGGGAGPLSILILCLLIAMGLIQVVRPQLLWRFNSRLQRGWVRNPEGTEPTERGYALQRVIGVVFLVVATWMLVRQSLG